MRVFENVPPELCLAIPHGLTALVGGGGKTTLLWRLAKQFASCGRVLVTTTTHIFPPEDVPVLQNPTVKDIREAFISERLLCIGAPVENGKLADAGIPFFALLPLCDYIFVEADGAKHHPLKAPAANEPVLPKETACVIAVAGMSGIGKTIAQAAHRPDRYAGVLGCDTAHVITPEDVARVLCSDAGQRKHVASEIPYYIVLNQADTKTLRDKGQQIAAALDKNVVTATVITALQGEKPCVF